MGATTSAERASLIRTAITLLPQSRNRRSKFRVPPSPGPQTAINFARAERSELFLPADDTPRSPKMACSGEHKILIFLYF